MSYTGKAAYQEPRAAATYDEERFQGWRGRTTDRLEKRYMLESLADLRGQAASPLILDAPVGTGRLSQEMIAAGYRVVAMDISMEMMSSGESSRHLRDCESFLGYVCADLEHLPFRDGAIDAVACLRIMGHLPPEVKKRVLSEFRRVGRLGAAILFYRDSPIIRIERRLFGALGLRGKMTEWFPLDHAGIRSLANANRWEMLTYRDLFRWLSEARVYAFRSSP